MIISQLYFIMFYLLLDFSGCQASDDREHVHIKVHMPEVIRKHNHFHKVKKHQHHQPRPHQHHHQSQHQPIDLELMYTPENVGPQFFPAPLAVLPEPELVDDDDDDEIGGGGGSTSGINNYAPDILSAMMEGDSVATFPQPYRPAMPPPPATHVPTTATSILSSSTGISSATTHLPLPLRQQLMQQLFSPEIMSAVLAGNGAVGDAVGGVSGDTNALPSDDFLTELKKEYAKKFYGEKLSLGKVHTKKKKKYNKDNSYRKQRPYPSTHHHHRHQDDQGQYSNNFQSSSIFDLRPKFHNYARQQNTHHHHHHHHQQQQQQQQLQHDFNEDLNEMMEEFDDKTSGNTNNNDHSIDASDEETETEESGARIGDDGDSYPDMFATFTQSANVPSPLPATTTATRLQWQPYRHQHDSHFITPSMHLTSTPFSSLPLTSSTAATSSAQSTASTNLYEPFYKKRKNRLKSKRIRGGGLG